jgi:hypothetical protein
MILNRLEESKKPLKRGCWFQGLVLRGDSLEDAKVFIFKLYIVQTNCVNPYL